MTMEYPFKKEKAMNSKIKKLMAQTAAVLTMVTGISVVGEAAKAEPAEAATMTHCRLVDAGYGYVIYGPSSTGRYATSCYWDGDWFENNILGMKDGWRLVNVRTVRCDWQYRVGC